MCVINVCSISSLSHCKTKYQYLNDLEVALSSSTQKQLLRAITRMAKKWSIQHLRSSCCPGLWCHLNLLLFFGGVQPWSEISTENGWWIIISPLKMASLDGIHGISHQWVPQKKSAPTESAKKTWKTGNHMAPGKSRSRWILFQPEVRGTRRCDSEKSDFRDAVWIHLGWWRHVKTTLITLAAWPICDSGPQKRVPLGTLNSVMVKEPYSNTIIRKILQSKDYCMILYDLKFWV